MGNGQPQSDREFLIQISTNVDHIKKTQEEKFDVIFNKLDNHGKRISEVETEQVRTAGRCNVENGKLKSLEKDIKNKPSAGKIILWVSIIVGVFTTLGVFANSFN